MKFRDLFIKPSKPVVEEVRSNSWFNGSLMFNGQSSYHQNKAMLHSVVFRCVSLISESVAQLPVVVYKTDDSGLKTPDNTHIVFTLFNKKPNTRMTKNTFLKSIVMNMLLTGNGYAYIKRSKNGQIDELQFIPSDMVNIICKNIFDTPKYQVNGIKTLIEAKDMLHFINIPSHDGISGLSTLQYAKKVLGLGFSELDAADAFFKSGNCKAGILKSEKPITEIQEEQILNNWSQTFNGTNGNPNGVVLLKPGLSYESIQTSPKDAELLDSRKFTVQEVCRFFSVSPSMCFDNSNNSYASVEAENLSFLTNTLTPMLSKIEDELNAKLWQPFEDAYSVKFDTSMLLRADKSALASYYNTMFTIGVLSPNDIRKELDLAPVSGGEYNYCQVNLSTLDKIANQELQDNPNISNQLKGNEEDK